MWRINKIPSSLRWVSWIFVFCLFFFWVGWHFLDTKTLSSQTPLLLYANQCHDNLERVYLNAIYTAKKSILLIIYSLRDENIIKALKKQAARGIQVTIIHDPITPKNSIQDPHIVQIEQKVSGLMHKKILIVDEEKIWMGSTNLTKESLFLDHNLMVALLSKELATHITHAQEYPLFFFLNNQKIEFWNSPKEKGLQYLISLIEGAKHTLKIAQFTWTHPDLIAAVIRAQKRGVVVEAILDKQQTYGSCRHTKQILMDHHIAVGTNRGAVRMHHKCLWVDDSLLVVGSANWTKAAFSKNAECFIVIHDLTQKQQKKLHTLWHIMRCSQEKKTVNPVFSK